MLLNKLGYDLPGNIFHVVPRDWTTRKQEFGSVTAKFTLGERIVPSAGTRTHKKNGSGAVIPFGNLSGCWGRWETHPCPSAGIFIVGPSWQGKPLPVHPSSCCILHGDKNPARENPKAGCVPWDLVPSWEKGDKAERHQSSCAWASQLGMFNSLGSVLLWISCRNFLGWEWGSFSRQDSCPFCVYNIKPCGNPPHKTLFPPSQIVRAVGFSLSPGAWVIFTQKNTTKTPLQPGREAPLLSPPSPECAAFQGCASLPLHSWEGAWRFIESRHLLYD